jgi:pimeloyl-ACP methyl ester carboxylesterase
MAGLEYVRRGAGEPLVLVHGLGGDRSTWTPVLDALAADYDVISLDLPGFGASAPLPEAVAPTPRRLAESVAELLDELTIGTAHLVGNSLGAWITLELALMGRARTVTSLCAAGMWSRALGPRPDTPIRKVGGLISPLLGAVMAPPAVRRRLLAAFVAHPERVPRRDAARMAASYIAAPGYVATNREMRSDHFRGAADIDVPVTLAWGEHDRLISPRDPGIPGARTVVLKDCGHVPTWDHPELVTDVILQTAGSSLLRS